jgi:hypothetical protein
MDVKPACVATLEDSSAGVQCVAGRKVRTSEAQIRAENAPTGEQAAQPEKQQARLAER